MPDKSPRSRRSSRKVPEAHGSEKMPAPGFFGTNWRTKPVGSDNYLPLPVISHNLPAMNRLLLSALLTLLLTPAASHSAETATKKIRIILVGDSTVNTKSGWGDGFKQLLTERAECFN